MKAPRKYCPIPFTRMNINYLGEEITLCCWVNKSIGSVNRYSELIDIFNSSEAVKIRESILDGSFRYCESNSCPYLMSNKLPLVCDIVDIEIKDIMSKRITDVDRMNINMAFDPRCNLKCLSCRDKSLILGKSGMNKIKLIYNKIEKSARNITSFIMNGNGDPFCTPENMELLSKLNNDEYKGIKTYIQTNGQLLNEKTWGLIKNAHNSIVSIRVSIDAAKEETYEKVRRGGSYKVLMKNLKFISRLRKKNSIQEFILNYVPSIYNYNEIPDFINIGNRFECDLLYFSKLDNWGNITCKEYIKNAVHLPENKNFQEFKRILNRSASESSKVMVGNLANLID